jgi:elongation factor G
VPLNLRPLPRDYRPLRVAILPRAEADRGKLAEVLARIAAEQPDLPKALEAESGTAVLSAMNEAEIEALFAALNLAGLAVHSSAPQVEYREILAGPVAADYTHNNPSVGQFAKVSLRLEPNARSMSNIFVNEIMGGAIPPEFAPGVEAGFRAATISGPLAGCPVVACRAVLLDGGYHDTDSSALAFEIATRGAVRQALQPEAMKLLEPYLEIDITTPEAFVGSVVGDFNSRRGVNNQREAAPGVVAIYGFAPLANMLGYEDSLKAMTAGRATYSWKLAGLEEVPGRGGGDPPFPQAAAKRG